MSCHLSTDLCSRPKYSLLFGTSTLLAISAVVLIIIASNQQLFSTHHRVYLIGTTGGCAGVSAVLLFIALASISREKRSRANHTAQANSITREAPQQHDAHQPPPGTREAQQQPDANQQPPDEILPFRDRDRKSVV